MLKQRYNQAQNAIHADEELIDRTLAAAAHPHKKTAPISPAGRRLIIGFVCTMVVIVALLPRLTHPHQDILTTNGELPEATGYLLPLPSDDLTLSVSDVKLDSDTMVSLILTVQGDKVDPSTTINHHYRDQKGLLPSIYGSGLHTLDRYEGQPSNERRFRIDFETKGRHILDALGPTLYLDIDRYTIGNQQFQTLHEIDWNNVDFTLQKDSEPIIDLGSGLSICGFGFTDQGWLTVQSRWPYTSLEPTYIMTWLSPDGTDSDRTNIYMREGKQYVEGDYIYSDTTFPVTREELNGIELGIAYCIAGEEIRGNWSITVDLSHLSAE